MINVILVIGHEKLNVEMRLYGSHLIVVKIPKSGGVCKANFFYVWYLIFSLYFSGRRAVESEFTAINYTITCGLRTSWVRMLIDWTKKGRISLISIEHRLGSW